MTRRFLVSAGLALALVACGGEDGGGSPPPTGGGGGGGGGGGTPTPSPSPSPSPSPTPTYQTFNQLTGTQTFQTACAGIQQGGGIQPIFPSDFGEPLATGNGLSFERQNADTWNIQASGFNTSFGPAALSASPPANTVLYTRPSGVVGAPPDRFSIVARPFGTQAAEYVRGSRLFFGVQAGQVLDFYCVFGVPTLLSDSVPTSTVNYSAFNAGGFLFANGPAGIAQFDLTDTTATLSANPANGEVTTRITIRGRQFTPSGLSPTVTDFGAFDATATVDGTQTSFRGVLENSSINVLSMAFTGWFFGPQGREAGFAFNVFIDQPDGTRLTGAGIVTARR